MKAGHGHVGGRKKGGSSRGGSSAVIIVAESSSAAVTASGGGDVGAKREGDTVESLLLLQRMCVFPGAVLRSGLVFRRVTALSLPKQGLGDGDIPALVGRLAGDLRKVDVSGNRLTAVPPGFLDLGGALEDLNLGDNEIAEMPPEVCVQTCVCIYVCVNGALQVRLCECEAWVGGF